MFRGTALLVLAALLPSYELRAQEPPAATQGSPAAMVLRAGDALRVQVYREPDLNGEFLVDENGVAILPLIGERKVTGIAVGELRRQLVEAYQVHLRNPSISITPLRRVNVLGEVQRPGLYAIDPTVSLAGAIALAGGATALGDLRKIRVVRGGEVIQNRAGAAETLSTVDVRSGDQVVVDRRSWFDRNSTFLVSAILSLTSIVTSIIISSR